MENNDEVKLYTWLYSSTSAPDSTKYLTSSVLPDLAAMCSGVIPSCSASQCTTLLQPLVIDRRDHTQRTRASATILAFTEAGCANFWQKKKTVTPVTLSVCMSLVYVYGGLVA